MSTVSRADVLAAFETQYGFDPYGVFCERTGKQVGILFIEESNSLLDYICASNDSAEAAADDLAMRVLASVRPSLKWNKFRSESLAELRKTDPVETLAYLINRMFAPRDRLTVGISVMLNYWEERIKAFRIIQSWGQNDSTNTLTYMLLELDAKWNLDTETPPFSWKAFFIDAPDMDARVEMLQSWYADRMAAWEKRLKQEEQMTRWYRYGSALAKPAFMEAYMESKPLSATAIKKQEKQAEKDMFANLLFEIMGSPTLEGEEQKQPVAEKPRPKFVPIRKNPMKFGVKK